MKSFFSKLSISNIKKRIEKISKSNSPEVSIIKNMAKLATGAGIAKIIALMATPIITRIYSPEHFGVLSIFTSIVGVLVPLGTLRYSMAIPLPRSDGMATNLTILCLLFLIFLAAIIFFLFWLFATPILSLLSMEQLLPWWWLIPIAIAGTGLYELLSNWAIREKTYGPLAKTQVTQRVIGSGVKIGLGLAGFMPFGLLVGQIFAQSGGIISLTKVFWKKFKENIHFVNQKRIVFLLRWYSDFPKFRLPSQVLMTLVTKTPMFYFAWHFGADTTGQFGLAMSILLLPMFLFGQSTGKAYYGEISKIGRKKHQEILKVTKSLTKKLFLVSIIPFSILLFFGPWLFQIVFGNPWKEAGVFSSILAINLLTMFVANPITHALTVFGKQQYYLQINIIRFLFVTMVFSVSYFFGLNSNMTLLAYSILISFHRFFIYLRILYIIKNAN
jgi:O-antigen/teichoic acid export membrane protein